MCIKQEFIGEVRQGFDKNLYPQSAYVFRAFGNSFMVWSYENKFSRPYMP